MIKAKGHFKIINMNSRLIALLAALMLSLGLMAQNEKEQLSGKVTFVTSNNIYVKFDNTREIVVGDTLEVAKATGRVPCLVVTQKSSSSCVCAPLEGCVVNKDDVVAFEYLPKVEEEVVEEAQPDEVVEEVTTPVEEVPEEKPLFEEKIRGRISAATYSNLYANQESRHRMMYRFSLNASNIANSRFSFETYLNYRQNFLPASDNSGRQTKFFRVYNLALRYDLNPTTSITVGRKINQKASSIGAIDGIQVEKFMDNFFVGAVAGFRPDIRDFGFNSNLLQYGAYFGFQSDRTSSTYSTTTVGFFEQQNAGFTDRRYTYLQHSSTINRKLNLFASAELDLYQNINGQASQNIRLSNLYLSARYRFSRKFDVNVSYDTRRRILYYETFKTEIEQMLDDDIARQGLRFRVNTRPIKYLTVGASYSMRFQSDQQNQSNNLYGFASVSRVPGIGGRASLGFNNNRSYYLDSKIITLRYSRPLIKKKVNADFYFRNVNYQYLTSGFKTAQKYFGANLSFRLSRRLTFSLMGEMSTSVNAEQNGQNYRINAKIVKRFAKKRKK